MASVTQRIRKIKQPRGGYLPISQFMEYKLDDHRILNAEENIHASLIGLAVDYLTRLCTGARPEEAFQISMIGAMNAECHRKRGSLKKARKFLKKIHGIDSKSIINACKLVTFDIWYRDPRSAKKVKKKANKIKPDAATVENIKIMVDRSIRFWRSYGPVIKDGFTFEPNGYTRTVDAGDGDFLTDNTMWDFKVSKRKPTSQHTLQILMYWIMGQHSGQRIYRRIKNIGFFNPRLNTVYLLRTDVIPREVIRKVERDIICYR